MKMTKAITTLLVLFYGTSQVLSATEVERLRAKCAEQELQIRQLETKISRLTDTPPPSSSITSAANDNDGGHEAAAAYTVVAGDNIVRISRKTGVSADTLNSLNGLKKNSIIHPGQTLKLPGTNTTTPLSPATESRTHTVQSGETFYKISQKYGVSVDDLIGANPEVNHRALRVGQRIEIVTRAKEAALQSNIDSETSRSLSASAATPITNSEVPVSKPRASDTPIRIEKEITYGQFAKNFNTTAGRLDELNGLELDPSTILARGSELYIPAQP